MKALPWKAAFLRDRLTAAAPLLFVALLAALTYWLEQIAAPPGRGPVFANRHDPDYIVDGLSAVRMSETGTARYTLSADKMVHYPDDDSTLLSAPRFVSYGADRGPVIITAREAVVSANGDHVYFQDDVRVTRSAYAKKSELVVRTPFLHVIPDFSIARTDRAVTITDAATTVTAVGLELNSETQVMKLLSNVRSTYDPRQAKQR